MTLILNFRNLLTWGKCLQDILHSSTVWLLPFPNCNKNSASGWSAKFHRKMLEQTHLNLLTASGFSSKTEIGRIYFWVDMHRIALSRTYWYENWGGGNQSRQVLQDCQRRKKWRSNLVTDPMKITYLGFAKKNTLI